MISSALAVQAGLLTLALLWARRLIRRPKQRGKSSNSIQGEQVTLSSSGITCCFHCATAENTDDGVRLLLDPGRDYKPSNPSWLTDTVALIEQQQSVAVPECPAVVDWLQQVAASEEAGPEFGAVARQHLFQLEPSVTYLNHGSYGATLRLLSEAQRWWQACQEAQPVAFMETLALQGMVHAQRAVASFVGCEPRDLVFLPNATSAANAVLRSLRLRRGDLVLLTDLTYPAVKSAAARVAAEAGAGLVEVRIVDALENADLLVGRFDGGLRAGRGRVRLAILDHIISPLPVHLPVHALCALCRAHAVSTLVDGAHAVGAVTLDLSTMGATYYTSNFHKWLCTPKGVAFLFVERGAQAGMGPLVTSHGYSLGFQGEFFWQGTWDYSAVLTLPAAISIFQALCLGRAARYRHALLVHAAQLLQEAWGTQQVLGLNSPEACMAAVELPSLALSSTASPAAPLPPSSATAAALHALLRSRYSIEVPILCVKGVLWCRISAQIYNELADYQRLADAVLEVAGQGLGEG